MAVGLDRVLGEWGESLSQQHKGFLLLALVVLLVILYRQRQNARNREFETWNSIPGPRWHAPPLLGNLLEILRPDFHRLLLEWANKYGGIYRAKVLWMDGLVVTDPAAVAAICGRGAEGLDKADIIYNPINQMCTPYAHPNLLTSPADNKWKAVRKAVAVSFSANNIRKKFPVIQACVDRLVVQLEGMARDSKKGIAHVDVDQAALRVTLDVIGLAAFSHNFGSTELGPPSVPAPYTHLLRVLPRCFTEIMLRVANPARALAPSKWRGGDKGQQSFFDFHAEMRMLLHKCLARPSPPEAQDMSIGAQLWRLYHESQASEGAAKGANMKKGDAEGDLTAGGLLLPPPGKLGTFMLRVGNLLRSFSVGSSKGAPASSGSGKGDQDAHISAERIMSEIGILFVEGFETTGHTISWTLLKVATTPGVQDRIAAELDDMGLLVKPEAPGAKAESTRPLALDDLPRLKYLTACIKESMRMLPVVSIMGRSVGPKPTRIGPYLIPAGTPVAIPLFAIQNTVHNWEAPDQFMPERWLQVPVEAYVMGSMPPLSSTSTDAGLQSPQLHQEGLSPTDCTAANTQDPTATSTQDCSPLKNAPANGINKQAAEAPAGESNGHSKRIVFAPFSEGPRSCVGQTLAKIEVATVLATLLAHFRVELAPEMGGPVGVRQKESTHLTLQLKGTQGLRMLMHPRSQLQQQRQ